jgi:hypothetical protein
MLHKIVRKLIGHICGFLLLFLAPMFWFLYWVISGEDADPIGEYFGMAWDTLKEGE